MHSCSKTNLIIGGDFNTVLLCACKCGGHHARLRIGCSKLNYHVCYHLHIPNINPECSCGEGYEDAEHFFMSCTFYNNIREILKRKIERYCAFTLNVLLYGADDLSTNINYLLFDAVHE